MATPIQCGRYSFVNILFSGDNEAQRRSPSGPLPLVQLYLHSLPPPQQPSSRHTVSQTLARKLGELPSEIANTHYWKAHNTKCINVSNAIHNQPINTSCLWLGLTPGTAKSRHSFLHHQSGWDPRKCWGKCAVWAVAYPRSHRDTDFPSCYPWPPGRMPTSKSLHWIEMHAGVG